MTPLDIKCGSEIALYKKVHPIQAGGVFNTLCPLQVFPCCAKTASSRLMKLYDF